LHEKNPKGFMKGFWKNLNIGIRKDDRWRICGYR
jgi:hypothetical protein